MKLNYKPLLFMVVTLFCPLSLFATEKPTYLDYDAVDLHFTKKTGLIHVEKGYKSGFIDQQGNKVIDTIYDKIGYFDEDDLTIAVKNDKYGVINKKGEVVVPFKYDKIVALENGYKAFVNDRWGLLDKDFNPILPFEYEEIKAHNNHYILYKNSKYQLANHKLEIITPTGFDEIKVLSDNTVVVRIEGRWHFFDKKVKQVDEVSYDEVEAKSKTKAGQFIEVRYKGDFAIMDDKTKKVVVPYGYKYDYSIGQGLVSVKKDGKYGAFNLDGKMVIPAIYQYIGGFGETNYSAVVKDNLVGVINTKNEMVIPFKYLENKEFLSGDYRVRQTPDKKWHILTKDDSKEIGDGFDKVYFVEKDHFAVKNNGKIYLADINNPRKILTKLDRYDEIKGHYCGDCYNGNIIVMKNNKYGLVNSKGKERIKAIYDGLSSWTTANLLFKKGNKYGVIDFNGKVEVEAKYDKLEWVDTYLSEPRAIADIGDKWQLFDINMQPVSPLFETDLRSIIPSMNNLVVKDKQTGIYGVLDLDGNEIIPTKYDRVSLDMTVIAVTQQDKVALFNKKGLQITPFKFTAGLYSYSPADNFLLVNYSINNHLYWTIYDITTGKALYTNEKQKNENQNL